MRLHVPLVTHHIANIMAAQIFPPAITLKLGAELGVGSFGRVYTAIEVEHPNGRVVALKKSRVSIKVSRTLLLYEAQVLCLLQGHPAIPEIYAWGHLEHFEYISMELLGGEISFEGREVGERTAGVAVIASQMISALEHVHGLGIIHRDVKPDNMLPRLSTPFQIQLIDFGIARTIPNDMGGLKPDDDSTRSVVGTITYASLNAHLGVPLTRRDDLESLAYTLFEFLREDGLPWDKHYPRWATAAFVRRQMHEGKRAWSGERLADGYAAAFGEFLEEVRVMGFGAIPDYRAWEEKFDELVKSPIEVLSTNKVLNVNEAPEYRRSQEPPVQAGQLVYVRILPKASIEGFPPSRGPICEWQDPTLSDMAWPTTFLPAIVLSVSPGHPELWSVSLLALTRREPSATTTRILVCGAGLCNDDEESVTVVGEGWPEGDFWCDNQYAINTFLWTPDQAVPLLSHWSVSPSDLQLLVDRLGKSDPKHGLLTPRQLWSLSEQYLFVEGRPLTPSTLEGKVDWNSHHAWLGDITPISARWAHDAGRAWSTCDESPAEVNYLLSDSVSSYYGDDYEDWVFPLEEREKSATLGLGEERGAILEARIGRIGRVL